MAVPLLGTKPDFELARLLRVAVNAVRGARRVRGIAPFKLAILKLTSETAKLFGTASDRTIGKRFGVSAKEILRWRRKFGIPGYGRVTIQ